LQLEISDAPIHFPHLSLLLAKGSLPSGKIDHKVVAILLDVSQLFIEDVQKVLVRVVKWTLITAL